MSLREWILTRDGYFCCAMSGILLNIGAYYWLNTPVNLLMTGFLLGMLITRIQDERLIEAIIKEHKKLVDDIIATIKGVE